MSSKKYTRIGKKYYGIGSSGSPSDLPPGSYIASAIDTATGRVVCFEELSISGDNIIDIPDPTFQRVTADIGMFLQESTRDKYSKMQVIYKRSCLLYGDPGVGKTVITNRVSQQIISKGGVVIYPIQDDPSDIPDFPAITLALTSLEDRLKMVVLEEFDQWIKYAENAFLLLLDGQVQSANTVYMATTNFINKIPNRIRRPGRFSVVIEMSTPTLEGRRQYVSNLLSCMPNSTYPIEEIARSTEGLTIDEIKSVILATELYGRSLDDSIREMREYKDGSRGRAYKDNIREADSGRE